MAQRSTADERGTGTRQSRGKRFFFWAALSV